MMQKVIIAIWVLLPLAGWSQQSDLLQRFVATSPVHPSGAEAKIQKHIDALRERQSEKEIAFLHRIFWSTQKQLLKKYTPYVAFGELFTSGKYDCLTATGLYSILLNEFHFDYDIIETNYHIFITVHTRQGEVLIETTDRYNGFVTDKEEMEKRIGSYRQNLIASSDRKANYYRYSFDMYKKISAQQIEGLLHFNQAINAFNSGQWIACADQIDMVRKKYDSPRNYELACLLLQTVPVEEESIRREIMLRFKSYRQRNQQVIAMK